MDRVLKIHAALATVALLFSLNYVISKVGLHAFSSMTFAYVRVLGSAIVLHVLFRQKNLPALSRADHWRIIEYSVLGVVINQYLFLAGLALTSAHVTAILMTLIPVFALGAAIVLGRERASMAKIAGIALALAGALAVIGREGLRGADKSLVGDLLLIGNGIAYALYLVLSKRDMKRLTPQRVITRMFAIAAVVMLPISAWSMWTEPWAWIPRTAWLALLFVIGGATVAAYLLNAWALAHTDSSLVAAYIYLQPVLTIILAAIFLGETIQPVAIVAAVMIFAGVYLAGRPAPPAARPEAVPGAPD
jgi:drug/metabolite transporter (DMT)-like permease